MAYMSRFVARPVGVLLAAWFAIGIGCSSSGGGGENASVSKTIDATGGTVSLTGGPTLQIKLNALGASTSITVRDTGQTATPAAPSTSSFPPAPPSGPR